MPAPEELESKFWKALESEMTMMLGLAGAEGASIRPMTAQFDAKGKHGPIWFFTSSENAIVQNLGRKRHVPAIATFTSKGHDLFAALHGSIGLDKDRAVVDRLWNRFVATWYEGGKDDPKLRLLRFEPDEAQIWLDGSSLIAGIRLLLGGDPKERYKDNVATIRLG